MASLNIIVQHCFATMAVSIDYEGVIGKPEVWICDISNERISSEPGGH